MSSFRMCVASTLLLTVILARLTTAAPVHSGVDPRYASLIRELDSARMAKRYDYVIAKATAALATNPDRKSAALLHATRGESFIWKHDITPAQEDATETLRLAPELADGHFIQAMIYQEKGRHREAIEEYKRALQIRPDWNFVYNNLAVSYDEIGDHDASLRYTAEAIRRNPKGANAHVNRGNVYTEQGDNAKAITEYNETLRIDPANKDVHFNRASLYYNRGDLDLALADLNEAVRRQPDSVRIFVLRAKIYRQKKMNERALADYRAATRVIAHSALDLCAQGDAFASLGEYDRAAAAYRRAVEQMHDRYPLNAKAWFEATCPDGRYRNGTDAVHEAQRACEMTHPKDAAFIDTLAAAFAETGNFDEATKLAVQASKLATHADKADLERHLEAFQQHHPWREEPLQR